MRSAPPVPPLPPRYRGRDLAMEAAREIRRRVARLVNYRAAIPLGQWRVSSGHVWRIRSGETCLAALRAEGVRARPYEPAPPADPQTPAVDYFPVPTPVVLGPQVGGVRFIGATGPIVISCELAARLPAMAKAARAHGVTRIAIASAYRDRPLSSFHTLGMGLDITRVRAESPLPGPDGSVSAWLSVAHDFVETHGRPTCDPELLDPRSGLLGSNERGRRLLAFACALHDSGQFASVLTPNYNAGHRDHFHVDIRPDDPRLFLR